jgi:DNA (cytosine-5)-methyltransferase 1
MHTFTPGAGRFKVKLSIEKDQDAASTLRLRAYVRQFEEGSLPELYYDYVRATNTAEQNRLKAVIRTSPEWKAAEEEVWEGALGNLNRTDVHSRIRGAVQGEAWWVLAGGPPCQAYSIVGRSRRIGLGGPTQTKDECCGSGLSKPADQEKIKAAKLEAFLKDERHTLYREYLEIVAVHQPPVFIMENVKGILSSKIHLQTPDGPVLVSIFDQILKDLQNPWEAIDSAIIPEGIHIPSPADRRGYRIHSFVEPPDPENGHRPRDYLIRAEEYGVPQERHRVILLGLREDLGPMRPDLLARASAPVPLEAVIGELPKLRSGRSRRKSNGARNGDVDTAEAWQEAIGTILPDSVLETIDEPCRSAMKEVLDRSEINLSRGARFQSCSSLDVDNLGELGRWLHDPKVRGVLQHETRDHMDSDFSRYLFVAAYGEVTGYSPKLRHFPSSLLPEHRNAQTEEGRQIFHDRFRVQLRHKPAATITSHIRKDGHYFIHYDKYQCRSLTVREAARVQTFPDNYFFEGNRTAQYEQIGNAVPPFLALRLARVVERIIQRAAEQADPPSIKLTLAEAG